MNMKLWVILKLFSYLCFITLPLSDENLLLQGLAVNDTLQRILGRRDEISNGITYTTPVVGVSHCKDEVDDEFSRLALR